MVYNQQIKIHGLMLENSGLAVDIASLSQTAASARYPVLLAEIIDSNDQGKAEFYRYL